MICLRTLTPDSQNQFSVIKEKKSERGQCLTEKFSQAYQSISQLFNYLFTHEVMIHAVVSLNSRNPHSKILLSPYLYFHLEGPTFLWMTLRY